MLRFHGDSDAHIVHGLIAILFAIYSNKTADDVLVAGGQAIFAELGLKEHLTPQRSNGGGRPATCRRTRATSRAPGNGSRPCRAPVARIHIGLIDHVEPRRPDGRRRGRASDQLDSACPR
jgi:hypothetical protein